MTPIQTESVTGFRDRYDAVIKSLGKGPVLLLQRSKLAAVVVSPDVWNKMLQELEELRDLVDVLEAKLAATPSPPTTEPADIAELEAMMGHAVPA